MSADPLALVEPPDAAAEMERAVRALRMAPRVALACHLNPDPDAAGSMLGLGLFLRRRGKEVVCSWGNHPFNVPRWVAALAGESLLVDPASFPDAPETMVTLDAASLDRLGVLAPKAGRAKELIVLDHHRSNPGFGTISVVDPTASSTAEIVYRLTRSMGGDLPDDAAACLYAGIVSDTGRFQYESTTADTLLVAADLRTRRFDHARIGQALYEDRPLGFLRIAGVALDRLVHVPAAGLVWTYVTQADLSDASVAMSDTDDLIDVVRATRDADVACVLKQQRDGKFKVSLRSRGATDTGSVATSFGGGGHRLAAGYTSSLGLEETVERMVEALIASRRADGGDG